VAVIAGLMWVTYNTISGSQGVIRVFISNSEHGQTSGDSIKKSEPVKITVSQKKQSPKVAPVQIEDKPAVEKSETLTEATYDKQSKIDHQLSNISSIETSIDTSENVEPGLKETTDNIVSGFSETDAGQNISDDGFYIGDFGIEDGPRFVKRVQPTYPLFARRAGKEGRVVLKLSIDEEGKLMEIEVVESAGNGFDDSAVKALKRSSFRPAMINGSPIKSRTKLPVRFVLKDR
jgi:protein TonB